MKTQKRKTLTKVLTSISALALLSACEPPTPGALTEPIPEYTREMNLTDWETRVSTFNVWDLPVISKDKKERMPAIGRAIASRDVDYVLLEEAWLKDGRRDIYNNANKRYQHDVNFKGTIGSGLMYLSDNPFTRNSFRPFQLFGPVILPDAWAIKGVGMVTVNHKDLPLSLFSTHLMAGIPRFEHKTSIFTPEWKGEMFELIAHVIEQTDSDAFAVAGDFNIHYGDVEYDFWKKLTSLEGTTLEENDGTCTWCKENDYAKTWSRQIDYVWVSPRLKIDKAWVDYKETIQIKNKDKHLSDHYGLTVDLYAVQGNTQKNPTTARENFAEALADVKSELKGYLVPLIAKEVGLREQVKTQGLDERLCLSCRIEKTVQMIETYQEALSDNDILSPDAQRIKVRLDSYFDLFR